MIIMTVMIAIASILHALCIIHRIRKNIARESFCKILAWEAKTHQSAKPRRSLNLNQSLLQDVREKETSFRLIRSGNQVDRRYSP